MNDTTIRLQDEDMESLKKQVEAHKLKGYEAVNAPATKRVYDFVFYEQLMIKKEIIS